MTPFVVTSAALECPYVREQHYQTTQLQKAQPSDTAPWLYSGLAQIREIENTGDVIPGIGDFRVPEAVALRARLLLALITLRELPVPVVSPMSGGGVSIVWEMGDKEVKFSLIPDGQAFYVTVLNDDIVSDGSVNLANPDSVEEPLRWISVPDR
jgi:hypothetical protein